MPTSRGVLRRPLTMAERVPKWSYLPVFACLLVGATGSGVGGAPSISGLDRRHLEAGPARVGNELGRPILTIDFKGLAAFVANARQPADTTQVDVILVAAEEALSDPALCRHDPLLVFRGRDFESAGEDTRHVSFQAHFPDLAEHERDQDIGVWHLHGEDLTLEGEKLPKGSLQIDGSFQEVLSLAELTRGNERVRPSWVTGERVRGVGARLRIDHGVLHGGPHVTDQWGLAKLDEWPTEWLRFRQSVRWEVFAEPEHQFLRLVSGPNEWIQLRPGARVLISNLCPLGKGGSGPDLDVLAYYAMAQEEVEPSERLVFHRKPQNALRQPAGGHEVKPAASACPPVRAYVD